MKKAASYLLLLLVGVWLVSGNDDSRVLQTAADPDMCQTSGETFTCNVENTLDLGGAATKIASAITCDLDDAIGPDFQNPNVQGCTCSATLTGPSGTTNECPCVPCPRSSPSGVAVNCTGTGGPISYIGCDGIFSSGGPGPTATTAAPTTAATSGGAMERNLGVGVMGAMFVLGFLLL